MTIFYSVLATVLFVIDVVNFCLKLTKIGFSWATIVTVLLIVILTRYFRLRRPPANIVNHIFDGESSAPNADHSVDWWPIANRAACLDGLENSKSAIEKVKNGPSHKVGDQIKCNAKRNVLIDGRTRWLIAWPRIGSKNR